MTGLDDSAGGTVPTEPAALHELSQTVGQLREVVSTLTTVVESNNASTAENTAYLKLKIAALGRSDSRKGKNIRVLALTLALDLAVTSLGLFVWHNQAETNRKIQQSLRSTYITQQDQQATRIRVLCPLYTLLLASVDPKARAVMPPAQQVMYDHTVRVIRDGYGTLGCEPTLPTAAP